MKHHDDDVIHAFWWRYCRLAADIRKFSYSGTYVFVRLFSDGCGNIEAGNSNSTVGSGRAENWRLTFDSISDGLAKLNDINAGHAQYPVFKPNMQLQTRTTNAPAGRAYG